MEAINKVQGYELVSGDALINMFNGRNKNCKESVFELQYSLSTDNGAAYYSYVHSWIRVGELGGWDEILPSDVLMKEFKKEGKSSLSGGYDERLYNTVYFQDDFYNDGTGKIYGYDYDEIFWKWKTNEKKEYVDKNGNVIKIEGEKGGFDSLDEELEAKGGVKEVYDRPNFRRFTPINEEERQMARCAYNIPLMRYANVLLMKAEILNKQGHPELAIPIINEIRAKHGNMPAMTGTTQSEVQAQIEHERIIEFPLESYRWYDLRRWGKLEAALSSRGFVADRHSFYPIPLWEINANSEVK